MDSANAALVALPAELVCASARRQVAGLAKNADAKHKGIARAADGIWRDVSEKAVFRRIG